MHDVRLIGKALSKYLTKIGLLASCAILYGSIVVQSEGCSFGNSINWKCKTSTILRRAAEYTLEGLSLLTRYSDGAPMTSHRVPNNAENRQRYGNLKSGFNFYIRPSSAYRQGLILLSRHDVDSNMPAIELWDLDKQAQIYKWQMKETCKKLVTLSGYCGYSMSPTMISDKSLIFNTQGWGNQLVKIDKEGKVVAVNDELYYHHKVVAEPSGYIYATFTMKNSQHDIHRGWGQGVAILDKNLKIKQKLLIHDIYKELNYTSRLYSANATDPIHVNDVEVIKAKGDTVILINLRSTSSVISYNVTQGYTMWILEGITKQGHDIDIISLNPFRVSLFDNNIYSPQESRYINEKKSKGNRVILVSGLPLRLEKDEARIYTPMDVIKGLISQTVIDFRDMTNPPQTVTSGLSEYSVIANTLVIEDTDNGRVFSYNFGTHAIEWEYINKNKKGDVFGQMSWSSRIPDK